MPVERNEEVLEVATISWLGWWEGTVSVYKRRDCERRIDGPRTRLEKVIFLVEVGGG
jgi:hypothetical protein